jgi:hypothetical protein
LKAGALHHGFNRRLNMSPTAIKSNEGAVLFSKDSVVFWTEHLAAKGFQNDALFGQCFDAFMEP